MIRELWKPSSRTSDCQIVLYDVLCIHICRLILLLQPESWDFRFRSYSHLTWELSECFPGVLEHEAPKAKSFCSAFAGNQRAINKFSLAFLSMRERNAIVFWGERSRQDMPVTASRRAEIKTRNKLLQPFETDIDSALTWACCILLTILADQFHRKMPAQLWSPFSV